MLLDRRFAHAILGTTADLTLTDQGIAVRSNVDFVGAGGALVSGTWQVSVMEFAQLVQSDVTLQGADTLLVGAGTWQIEGSDRSGTFSE